MRTVRTVSVAFGATGGIPSALDRIVSLARTRYCEVIALDYRRSGSDGTDVAAASITLTGDEARLELFLQKLAMFVDVASVEIEGGTVPPSL
jgi:hypothetical protein